MFRVTTLADLPIRETLRGKEPYGAPMDPVPIALNVNENTHPLPQEVLDDIQEAVGRALLQANRYPDREAMELRAELASYLGHGLTAEEVWAANGSNEILQQMLQAFGGPGRSMLSFTPTYSMYPILSDITGTEWIPVPRADDFSLTPELVRDAIRKHEPSIVILCGPNNPTGTRLSTETILAAYEAFDGMLIIDEAYAEFDTEQASAVSLLNDRPRLVISRTMSKAFAFAGIRLGYLAAHSAVVDALRLIRLPYHLSVITQAAAVTAVRHAPQMLAMVDDIRTQRIRLAEAMTEMGYRVYESGANFILVGGFDDPDETFQRLLDRGILIRNLGIPGHLRLTAGTEPETTALIDAIRDLGPGGTGAKVHLTS